MVLFIFGLNFEFGGNFFSGLALGVKDGMKCWNDDAITQADFDRSMLQECLPPSDHFKKDGYLSFVKNVLRGNAGKANDALTTSVLETATPFCVILFKRIAIEIVRGCPRLLIEALPTTYY